LGERKLNLLTIQHRSKMAFSAGLENEKELRLAIAILFARRILPVWIAARQNPDRITSAPQAENLARIYRQSIA
jgi:hypothetical protein